MISFDASNILSSSQSCKWHENIVGKRHDVALSVNKGGLIFLLFRIHYGHEQRGLHIDCAVQVEYCNQLIVYGLIQWRIIGRVSVLVIDHSSGKARRLLEQRCKSGLVVGGIGFCYISMNVNERLEK